MVGIDRGLKNLLAVYDEGGDGRLVSGSPIARKRKKYLKLRQRLQAKGTKSAKRHLKKLSGRENRWMTDVNHCLSKALVQEYGSGTLFVLEGLSGVSFERSNMPTELRSELSSWAFYQFAEQLKYKAAMAGSIVIEVPAQYTSQRCTNCGRIRKANRDRERQIYKCDVCGHEEHDDLLAAHNLVVLGIYYLQGDPSPRFFKVTTSRRSQPSDVNIPPQEH